MQVFVLQPNVNYSLEQIATNIQSHHRSISIVSNKTCSYDSFLKGKIILWERDELYENWKNITCQIFILNNTMLQMAIIEGAGLLDSVFLPIDIDIFVNCSWIDTRWQ
jgi:hypothetical protein